LRLLVVRCGGGLLLRGVAPGAVASGLGLALRGRLLLLLLLLAARARGLVLLRLAAARALLLRLAALLLLLLLLALLVEEALHEVAVELRVGVLRRAGQHLVVGGDRLLELTCPRERVAQVVAVLRARQRPVGVDRLGERAALVARGGLP